MTTRMSMARIALRRCAAALAAAAATLALAGCSVHGKWSLARVDPEAARRDFELASLTLQRDGTFYAEAREGAGLQTTSGTYTYADDLLVLKEHDGESHSYEAKLASDGRTLELMRHWKNERLLAYFEREE